MIRTASRPLFLAAIVSTSLFAAACSDDDEATATFSTLDAAHLDRALDLTAGTDLASLYVTGLFVSGANDPTACPAFVTAGNVTTVTGGCTNDDGARLEGRIVITNMPALFGENPSYDPTQPSVVEAFDWTASGGDSSGGIDGKVTLTASESGSVLAGEAEATVDGIAAHSAYTMTCDETDLCTLSNAWFDADGVGRANLSGTFRFDEPATGAITAAGAETLVLDVAAGTADCRTFRIGDAAPREVCDEVESGKAARAMRGVRSWL